VVHARFTVLDAASAQASFSGLRELAHALLSAACCGLEDGSLGFTTATTDDAGKPAQEKRQQAGAVQRGTYAEESRFKWRLAAFADARRRSTQNAVIGRLCLYPL